MNSALTNERPDLWNRAIALAVATTGLVYIDKLPLADGTISACGSPLVTPVPLEDRIKNARKGIINYPDDPWWKKHLEDLLKEKGTWEEDTIPDGGPKFAISVPEGAFDWLLHEVGHWIAATPSERLLPQYGLTYENSEASERIAPGYCLGYGEVGTAADREWEAWAFQEIVLAPWGYSRDLTPPTYRGGVGYSKQGPMPSEAMRHIEKKRIDLEPWRMLSAEWIAWGKSRGAGREPWNCCV